MRQEILMIAEALGYRKLERWRRCGCWPPSPFLEFQLGAGAAAAAPDSMV
jgi:hypothetical protein